MLKAKAYREMLERMTEPQKLVLMKNEGRFEKVVQRFADGWGDTLLSKLRTARTTVPVVNDDGTISFYIPGGQGPMTHPITLAKVAGRWSFSD